MTIVKAREYKACARCGEQFPLDSDNFQRNAASPDGFRGECKQCRAIARRKIDEERRNSLARTLDECVMRAIEGGLPQGNEIPHYTEIYSKIVDMLGGATGLAAHIVAQYLNSPDGSQVKQRYLLAILDLGYKAAEDSISKVPTEYLEEQDIIEELRRVTGETLESSPLANSHRTTTDHQASRVSEPPNQDTFDGEKTPGR